MHPAAIPPKEESSVKRRVVREEIDQQIYEYVPLGKYVVSAPSVCRGRPTFKYTRIEVAGILDRLAAGESMEKLVHDFRGRFSRPALEEAIVLAARALVLSTKSRTIRK
jgi:uncharacterized protein (DUF433 family)